MFFKISDRRDFIKEIELYPERQDDGRILKQLSLGFPVFYEGSEGDTIRLLKQNTVETVCLLSQRKPDTTIEVDLDISELEVSSAETKATYEEIKSYVLKKFGLKVSNLYIAQVKRECGIVERINYNLPKTEGNRVPQCPEDKRKAIKDAFIHFQMI